MSVDCRLGATKRVSPLMGDSLPSARSRLDEKRRRRSVTLTTEVLPEVTLGELAEQWWATRSGHRPSTRARDRVALDHDIVPSFGHRILHSVSHADVQHWVNDLAERVSPVTVRRNFVVLARLFGLAEAHGLGTIPARRVQLLRIEQGEMCSLTLNELDRLAEAVGAFATLRIGEATGYDAGTFDPLHRRVQVANNIVEVGHERHEGLPKTRAGKQTMTLSMVVMAVVEEYLEHFAAKSYVFPWDDDRPLRAEEWRRTIWRPAVIAAGLAPPRPKPAPLSSR